MTDGQNPEDEVLVIKVVRREKRIKLEDENGEQKPYVLREMLGTEKGKWQTGMARRVRFDSSGKALGIQDWTGLEAALITKCLYEADTGKRVDEDTINKWGTVVQQKLFQECRKLNGLVDDGPDAEKKD